MADLCRQCGKAKHRGNCLNPIMPGPCYARRNRAGEWEVKDTAGHVVACGFYDEHEALAWIADQ